MSLIESGNLWVYHLLFRDRLLNDKEYLREKLGDLMSSLDIFDTHEIQLSCGNLFLLNDHAFYFPALTCQQNCTFLTVIRYFLFFPSHHKSRWFIVMLNILTISPFKILQRTRRRAQTALITIAAQTFTVTMRTVEKICSWD